MEPLTWIKFRGPISNVLGSHFAKQGTYDQYMERWDGIELPVERKPVLVQTAPKPDEGLPAAVAVGYLRYSAGDKTCPFFVIPGVGGDVTAFADCLPEPLDAECWPGFCGNAGLITERVRALEESCQKARESEELVEQVGACEP
jgi:hypothetical protein